MKSFLMELKNSNIVNGIFLKKNLKMAGVEGEEHQEEDEQVTRGVRRGMIIVER